MNVAVERSIVIGPALACILHAIGMYASTVRRARRVNIYLHGEIEVAAV